jgi:hypothetical protein
LKEHHQKRLKLDGTRCVRVNEATPDQYRCYTAESLWNVVDRMANEAQFIVKKTPLITLEKKVGFKYIPKGLLLDLKLRRFFDPVDSVYFDFYHCWTCSGGVAQYHVNGFVHAIKTRITIEQLDEFAANIRLPRRLPKVPKDFFKHHVNNDAQSCFRAFSSELITAAVILHMFCVIKLEAHNAFPEQVGPLKLMMKIIDTFLLGDRMLPMLAQLDTWMRDYVAAFRTILPECETPKLHTSTHIPKHVKLKGKFINTLPGERAHRIVKNYASGTFGAAPEVSVTKRVVLEYFAHIESNDTFGRQTYMSPPIKQLPPHLAIEACNSFGMQCAKFSTGVVTSVGHFDVGDMVLVDDGSVGEVTLFASGEYYSGRANPLVVVKAIVVLWRHVGKWSFVSTGESYHVDVQRLSHALAYLENKGARWVRLPAYPRGAIVWCAQYTAYRRMFFT